MAKIVCWFVVRTYEGLTVLWKLGRFILYRHKATAELLACQDGHAVATYGRWECQCSAVFTGWVFAACPNCGSAANWTPCPCGLPVYNPLR
jgi:hypothetical protein